MSQNAKLAVCDLAYRAALAAQKAKDAKAALDAAEDAAFMAKVKLMSALKKLPPSDLATGDPDYEGIAAAMMDRESPKL